jgi:hypothetical protein
MNNLSTKYQNLIMILSKLKPEHKNYTTLNTKHLNNIKNQEIPIIKLTIKYSQHQNYKYI